MILEWRRPLCLDCCPVVHFFRFHFIKGAKTSLNVCLVRTSNFFVLNKPCLLLFCFLNQFLSLLLRDRIHFLLHLIPSLPSSLPLFLSKYNVFIEKGAYYVFYLMTFQSEHTMFSLWKSVGFAPCSTYFEVSQFDIP